MKRYSDVILVATAAFVAYVNNLGGAFVYDDRFIIEQNPLVQNADMWRLISTAYWGDLVDAGLYRPLTSLTFGLNRLLGAGAFSFHLVNNLLHAGASVLVLLAARGLSATRFVATASGLVFALHPLHTEAVTSIVGRAEILALIGTLGAFIFFARGTKPVWVGALFFLALCSKESAAFALALFALYRVLFERKSLVPVAAAVAAYVALRVVALGGFGIEGREIGFIDNPIANASLTTRLSMAGVLLAKYASLAVWPASLSADYSYNAIPMVAGAPMVAGLGVAIALGAFAWRQRGLGAFAALAFFVPLLGFVHVLFPLGALFAERFTYLPLFGASLLIALGLSALPRREWILTLVLLAMAARVVVRNHDWRDNETLFRATVATTPESARSHFLLGAELLEQSRFVESAASFETGLAIVPNHAGARMSLAEAQLASKNPEAAFSNFEQVLRQSPDADIRDRAAEAAMAAGRATAREENWSAAATYFERAIELDTEDVEAYNALGLVAERRGDPARARSLYVAALQDEPDYVPAMLNLASVQMGTGELVEAETLFRRVVSLAPDSYEAYNGLGIALGRQGKHDGAEAAFRKAHAIDPSLDAARDNLRALGKTP